MDDYQNEGQSSFFIFVSFALKVFVDGYVDTVKDTESRTTILEWGWGRLGECLLESVS